MFYVGSGDCLTSISVISQYLVNQWNGLVGFAVVECFSRRLNIMLCLQSWTKQLILRQIHSLFSKLDHIFYCHSLLLPVVFVNTGLVVN